LRDRVAQKISEYDNEMDLELSSMDLESRISRESSMLSESSTTSHLFNRNFRNSTRSQMLELPDIADVDESQPGTDRERARSVELAITDFERLQATPDEIGSILIEKQTLVTLLAEVTRPDYEKGEWQMHTEERTGQVFYWNKSTDEAVWATDFQATARFSL
jgi:hypothetical protein